MRNFTLLLAFVFSITIAKSEQITINKKKSPDNKVHIVSESNDELIISVEINNFNLSEIDINGELHHLITSKNLSHAYESGQPDVLKMAFSIQIPNNLWMNQYEILSSDFVEYQNINLAPSRRVIYRTENPNNIPFTKGGAYALNQFYPQNIVQLGEPYIVRDYRGESVITRPFQYNPITKVLRVYTNITFKITSNNEVGINELRRPAPEHINSEFNQLYQNLFINYSQENRYASLNDQGNLLIIAHDNYINEIKEFANWKRQRGIPTEIVDLATTGSSANEIKAYIENYYNTNGLTYVILVGDNTHIPSLSSNGDSDQAYAQISGSDHYPELIIGRFSVESAGDIATITERSIWYERDVTTNDTWFEDAIGIASDEGDSSTGDDGESDQEHMENIRTKLLNYGYGTVEEDYANNGINASTLASHVVKGVGLINYVGHGDHTLWVTSGFNNTDVNNLTNDYKLPFIFDVACVNGNFHGQTCFAEAWTRASHNDAPTGAVAIIASTVNQPWAAPMDGQDEMVDILTESYTNNIKRTFGGITYNGVMHMLDEYPSDNGLTADTWTIFGDPSLHVRTKTPMELTVTHSATLAVGETSFTVNSAVEGALVALTKTDANNDIIILGTGIISGGSVNITIPAFSSPAEMIVTVTEYNYIPEISIVQIIAPDGPFLTYNNHSINDASENDNGEADFGESILLNFAIQNVGVDLSTNANVVISTSNTNIVLTDDTESYGTVNVDQIKNINNAFALNIGDAIQDQESILFDVNITDDDAAYSGSFNIIANAPALEIEYLSIDDASGNDNGVLDAGESVTIHVKAKNIGHASISSAIMNASGTSNYFTLTNTSVSIPSLNAINGVYSAQYDGDVAGTVPDGESVNFSFNLSAGNYSAVLNITLPIGISLEDWESETFDTYDWTNESSTPWVIVSDVVLEGSYASKSGNIGHSATSILSIEMEVTQADSISFFKKVSCEDSPYSGSGYWYDFLQFDVNGSEKGKWDANIDWSREAYFVEAGNITLEWIYSKDNIETGGSDCAWLDNIILPPHSTSTVIQYQSTQSDVEFSVYPIPTKENLNIKYSLATETNVQIKILDISGKLIKTIVDTKQEMGIYNMQINGLHLNSGIYLLNFVTESHTSIKKLIIK